VRRACLNLNVFLIIPLPAAPALKAPGRPYIVERLVKQPVSSQAVQRLSTQEVPTARGPIASESDLFISLFSLVTHICPQLAWRCQA
jgi:hypothetical protein